MRICYQRSLGVFQHLDSEVTSHGGEVLKEDLKWVTSLKMLKEDSHGHSGTDEYGGAAHNFGVRDYAGGLHGVLLGDIVAEFTLRT
jgi:hypothetical protein